jgi:hypothetical protein
MVAAARTLFLRHRAEGMLGWERRAASHEPLQTRTLTGLILGSKIRKNAENQRFYS